MNDEGAVVTVRLLRMVEQLGLALVEAEPVLDPVDGDVLRDLVVILGWWAGRLSARVDGPTGSGTMGAVG